MTKYILILMFCTFVLGFTFGNLNGGFSTCIEVGGDYVLNGYDHECLIK